MVGWIEVKKTSHDQNREATQDLEGGVRDGAGGEGKPQWKRKKRMPHWFCRSSSCVACCLPKLSSSAILIHCSAVLCSRIPIRPASLLSIAFSFASISLRSSVSVAVKLPCD
uniref:Uncharacterized protein n=1 Tax=Physcomitrium patens TaxID=3218 RepID=A0A2K1KJT5_PHYPA|nr:hypothetical protein PHYPA_007717 [Physcomitrium patens]